MKRIPSFRIVQCEKVKRKKKIKLSLAQFLSCCLQVCCDCMENHSAFKLYRKVIWLLYVLFMYLCIIYILCQAHSSKTQDSSSGWLWLKEVPFMAEPFLGLWLPTQHSCLPLSSFHGRQTGTMARKLTLPCLSFPTHSLAQLILSWPLFFNRPKLTQQTTAYV